MSLLEALSQAASARQQALPSLTALESRTRKVLQRWPNLVPETPDREREAIVQRMMRRIANDDWERCRLSQVTRAAGVAFDADFRDRPDLLPLRQFYLAEIRASTRSSFLRPMTEIYVRSYVPGAVHTMGLSSALDRARDRIGGRWEMLLRHVPALFDPYSAPGAIARLMEDMPDPWEGLKSIGIASPHAPGLMDFAQGAWLKQIAPQLTTVEGVERVFDWLNPPGQSARSTGASDAIEALLSPWLDTPCPDMLREKVVEGLLQLYGDPRPIMRGAWATVSRRHQELILRWLTRADMMFFIGVVDATQDNHMWPPRRDFWMKLYEQGRISEAWVAFSPAAASYARKNLISTQRLANERRFGRQTAGGNRLHTSLLIMRIGSKIVVEGCHNYKTHIFRDDDPKRPRLFAETYDCDLIRLDAFRRPFLLGPTTRSIPGCTGSR